MAAAFALLSCPQMSAAQAVAPPLGAASSFVLFTSVGSFDNVGPSVIRGDIGTNAGAFSGFPPGVVTGSIHVANTRSTQAATDVQAAFAHMSNIACVVPLAVYGGPVTNPQVLTPNSYCVGAATTLAGSLILDGQNNPNALFFLRVSGALTTGEGSTVTLINGASLSNVYWQVTGRVDLGKNSTLRGTLIVDGAINMVQGATLLGRGLTRAGAITIDSNTATLSCDAGFSYASNSFCQNGSNPSPTGTSTAVGTYSSTTGLSINATTGTITLATSTLGTYTVTRTTPTCSSTANVTIAAPATADFSYSSAAYCTSATGNQAAVLASGSTTGGMFTSTTGLTLNATTGAITPSSSTPGAYNVTYSVTGNCPANSTRPVTINAVPTAPTLTSSGTTATGITLTSSAAAGNQFYLNGVALAGATGQTYLINSGTRNGSYTVTTTSAAGCTSAASAPVAVVVTAARTAATGPTLNVYPNPTPDGQLQVKLVGSSKAVELTVRNVLGQAVFRRSAAAGGQLLMLDLSALPAGVYVLQGRSADGTTERRFVRE